MNHSFKVGFSFGLTSGVITTLGLMVGLNSGTHSTVVVIGGIFTIAIADAFSDALGIHISEESENVHTAKEIWLSTISVFLTKLIISLSFCIPVLLLPLSTAIIISIIWGFFLLGIFSYFIAQKKKTNPWMSVLEHVVIAVAVIVITNYVGEWINEKWMNE